MVHACRLQHEEGWGWFSGDIVHDGDKASGWAGRWLERSGSTDNLLVVWKPRVMRMSGHLFCSLAHYASVREVKCHDAW